MLATYSPISTAPEYNIAFEGVTLAQLVKASVGQSDVQGFEPHLGHN